MRYVIIRDDDTNALTPVACLERLYRPFLDRGLPVNLAVIPDVATDTRMSNGLPEGFLMERNSDGQINSQLVAPRTPETLLAERPRRASPLAPSEGERVAVRGPFTPTKITSDPTKLHVEESPRIETHQSFSSSSSSSSSTQSPPCSCWSEDVTGIRSRIPSPQPSPRSGGESEPEVPASRGLVDPTPAQNPTLPFGSNRELVRYILDNPGYRVLQHGCHHDQLEFDRPSRAEVAERLERGAQLLTDAGFARPDTFVAPYDKLSRASLIEVAKRFRVLSTGWFELRRLPHSWWPNYALKKLRRARHWRAGGTLLLSHPGCLLSYQNPHGTILGDIARQVSTERLTVLVTHWWEYFRDGRPDEPFIDLLHETADYLSRQPDLKVISFSDLANGNIPLN